MISSAAIKILRRSKRAKATAKRKLSPMKPSVPQGQAGFTLLELLIVVILIGVIATIAVPSWVVFTNQRRVNAANDTVLRALQDAQSRAKTKKVSYSVSFRTLSGQAPEMAVYPTQKAVTPTTTNPSGVENVDPYTASDFKSWQNLGRDVAIEPKQVILQTNVGTGNQANNVTSSVSDRGTITFDEMGALSQSPPPNVGTKGLIVRVGIPNGNNPIPSTERCIIVKTLLGSMQIQKGAECNF